MSKCSIIYDNNGNKVGVQENNQLFQEILNNPLNKNFDSALEIFLETYSGEFEMEKRVADKLPLTLPVFDLKQFAEMRGKMVNPISVQQMLNGGGIKQIEKDLINQVIEDNYKGQKRISYDELEATVRANIMPLERITTSSYADYGMDNLGSGNYGEAKTLILNAPIEHGVTGHFSGDFKASGRQNIKYVSKQLNDNVWVAVEEGYEANANDNNIYQYVGTAGTKEAIDAWINQYNGGREVLSVSDTTIEYNIIYPTVYNSESQISVDLGRGNDYLGTAQINYDENLSEEQIKKQAVDIVNQKNKNRFTDNYESNINKGMFGHIRVWQDGNITYISELQSDYFQKNNAKKDISLKSEQYKKIANEIGGLNTEILSFLPENLTVRQNYGGITSWELRGLSTVRQASNIEDLVFMALRETNKSNDNTTTEINRLVAEKEKLKKEQDNIYDKLSSQEKQFIASQKIWEQRMVREAIKEASLSGATSLRFPTPYTLSVIEGYIKGGGLTSTTTGDIIEYLGEDYIILNGSEDDGVRIIPVRNMTKVLIEDFEQLKAEGEVGEDEDIYDYYIGDVGEGVESSDGQYFYYTRTYRPQGLETIEQGSIDSATKETFEITDLADTQQTVARKYEEIAEILKKEKPVEIVTDENGFDWYEAPITQEDTQSPVVAFSLSTESPTLKYQTQDGQVFSDYGQALRNTQGEDLEAGLNTTEGFKPLFTISTNTNINTTEGMINNLIKSDLLSGEKYIENGINYYKPQGKSEAKQVANAQVVKDLLQQKFGVKAVKVGKDGFISIIEENKRENISLNGRTIKIADLHKMDFKELKDNFGEETAVNVIANNLFLNASQKTSTKELKEEFIPENELQEKLKNLLKKFGIKTLAFEEYIKKYEIRNKLPINARALADLANKVIAFKDGNIENDDLVEETSHLIVASIPEEKKANIKRNIHKTKEWGQYAEGYKQIYATEDEVREEILGKVVANSIKEQFQARNTNQTEDSIINKIKELVQEFFDRISAYFQDSFQKELDTLNKAVYNNLMQETLQLDLSKATGVFFNDGQATPEADKLYNQVSKMLDTLRAQSRELAKKYTNSADRAMLNLAEEDLERGEYVKAIATLTKLTSSQVEQIHRSIDNAKQGEMPLSSEENIVTQALKETLLPALSEVALKLDVKKPIELALSKEIDNIITRGGSLQGKVKTARKTAFDQIIEKNIEIYNMTKKEKAEYKELIAKAMSGAQKDTDYVHAHLGSLLLARNPLLNIAGRTIERMNQQKLELAQGLIKRLANAIGTFSNKDLLQLFDPKTMDLVSEVDYKKDEELKNEAKIKILNPLLKEFKIDLVVDKNTDFKTIFKTINNKPLEEKFRKEYADWEEAEDVNIYYFKKEYRKAIKEHSIENFFKNGATLDRSNITYSAVEIDNQLRAQSTQIRINGNSKANDAELKKVSKFRQEKSNPRDSEGNLLQGIQENYNETLQKWVIEKDALAFSQITSDEQRDRVDEILGLNHLAYLSQDFHKDKKQELNAQFLAEVDALPEEEKWNFIENNSYISFPKEFFDNFKDNPSIILKLNALGTLDAKEKLKQIRAKQSLINNVLKEISVYNKPGEVNFVEMESTQKETIKLAQTELENLYSQARKLLPKEEREALNVDNRVNDAYINHLEDSGEDELEFIMKNVTPTSFSYIQDMQSILMGRKSPNKTFENNFSDSLIDEEGKLKPEAKQALIEYGKTKLLPYLKKTEPINFTELKNSMSASDFIRRNDLISVSPNISYTEKTNENVNQDYIENKKLGKPQYSEKWLEKVKSTKYEELFGNNKNPELFKAYTELVDVMKEAIEMQGLTGKRDLFMSPQVRATEIERFTRLTPSAIKQSIQDLIQFRPEEKERGEQTGQGMYTIPNYYNSRLEDPSEITRNVLYSYATYIAKASENKARRENIGDMFVIDEILSSTDLVNKKAQSSQTYKMFKNFKEFNFYGVQESFSYEVPLFGKTVDIGKVLKVMNSWAKKTNLTGLTVPLTSFFQSATQRTMERVIGQFISPLSANEGNRLFKKHATDAIKEVGGFKSESFLNVTLEALGLYPLTHRYEDSQYSKTGRNLYNLGNKLHEGGNFPVIAPAICGIISDYRYVDGKVIDEKTFKKLKKEGNWSDYDLFSKDFEVAVQNGVLDFKNEKFLNAVNSADKNGKQKIIPREGQTLDEYLEEVRLNISMRSLSFVQQIDSQIPQHQKAVAQRDQRINFFLSHAGWLLTAIPRRVRNRSFSYAEGEFQEGSWRTVWELLQNSKGNPKKMRELYREMDDFQKKNIIRGGAELAFANALGILALVLSNYVDDEDEVPYLVAIADVFATRVATEQIGSTVALPKSIYQAMSPSIMLKQKMENWLKVNQLFDSEKRNKYIGGLVPFYNDVTRFRDPKTYQNSYFHFQADDGKTFYQTAWLTNFLEK